MHVRKLHGIGLKCALVGVLSFGFLLSASDAYAKRRKVKIKLGTLAPKDSPWYNGVKRIGQRWRDESNGKIKLKIYPGGVAGDEGDMIRKMRIGQLHAGTVTGVGISSAVKCQPP